MKRKTQKPQGSSPNSDWIKTKVANLVHYKPSGIYFARVRIRGKLFRHSLKTDVITVAKLRLADFIKEKQEEMGDDTAVRTGKLTVGDALRVFEQRLDAQTDIKEGAKVYRRKCIDILIRTWPSLAETPVSKVSKDACIEWAAKLRNKYAATVYNNTVGTLQMIFAIAVEKGARAQNPALNISRKKITHRELNLPSPAQFQELLTRIDEAGGRFSRDCGLLVRFLAFGGCRKTEAANILWSDCDLAAGRIRIRVTKNGKPRTVPMIPDMRALLEEIKAERPEAQPLDRVMKIQECQKAIDHAAKDGKIPRITHHDLRHLFATKCIEAGVDIPTVSRWLGHQDGGALAMKTYGHLRDHHSVEMAQKVSFNAQPASNVIQMPKEAAI